MALQLTHELPSGLSCNYWRISEINLRYPADPIAVVNVDLYKDAAARTAGKAPAKSVGYAWSGSDFTGWFDAATLDTVNYNPQERAYEKLKTLPEFTGATDV